MKKVSSQVIEEQEAWHRVGQTGEPAFQNSWSNYSAGTSFSVAGFMKDSMGFVHLTGLVKGGATNGVIFTLPAGYRPDVSKASAEDRLLFGTISNSAIGRVDVYENGNILSSTTNNNAWVALDGITFKAA